MPAVYGNLKELGEEILPCFAYINQIFIHLPISQELVTKVKVTLSLSLSLCSYLIPYCFPPVKPISCRKWYSYQI